MRSNLYKNLPHKMLFEVDFLYKLLRISCIMIVLQQPLLLQAREFRKRNSLLRRI